MTLLFLPSRDDGGQIITAVELEASPLLVTSWQPVSSYDGLSMSHTVTTTGDGLSSYAHYRFRIRAVNAYGPSDYSRELVASVAPLPGAFAAVTKDQLYSSNSTIMVRWAVAGTEIEPVLGFRLRMVEMASQVSRVVYDNAVNANVLEYVVSGLTPGASYSFSVLGYNFNGAGELWSPEAAFLACSAPSGVPVPRVTGQSEADLAFAWQAPADDGGCPITGYELLLESPATSALESVHAGPPHVTSAS